MQGSSLPDDWRSVLSSEITSDYFEQLNRFVSDERSRTTVYPAPNDVFNALVFTPLDSVRACIIGQDPYHDDNQAHGLCFSVRDGVMHPPSLRNIFRELAADLECPVPASGCLTAWARRGVLLLNTVLTVRQHEPNSHAGHGWERFTDGVIRTVNDRREFCVFLLWGTQAQRKSVLLTPGKHAVVAASHPSPLSAHRGFMGSRPFSRADAELRMRQLPPIDWRLGLPQTDLGL